MKLDVFERLVQKALDRLPDEFQKALRNVAVIIKDHPGPEAAMEDGDPIHDSNGVLYGLYCGIPLPERTASDSGTAPDLIYLYQKSLEEDFPIEEDLIREVEVTVVHEIAHYFGFDEGTLEHYGYG